MLYFAILFIKQTHSCQKWVCQYFSLIFKNKKVYLSNLSILSNLLLGVVCHVSGTFPRHIPQEGGWDTGIGRSCFIKPNNRILIDNPFATESGQKIS
jgi:hypothetical protein